MKTETILVMAALAAAIYWLKKRGESEETTTEDKSVREESQAVKELSADTPNVGKIRQRRQARKAGA